MKITELCYGNYFVDLYFQYDEWRWKAHDLETGLGVERGLIGLKSKFEAWKDCKKIIDKMERHE